MRARANPLPFEMSPCSIVSGVLESAPAQAEGSAYEPIHQIPECVAQHHRSKCSVEIRDPKEGDSSGHLRYQPSIRQALTYDGINERIEALKRMPRHVALVQSPGELLDVAVQVLGAHLMVNAVDTALQDGPNALNAICGHRPACVLTGAVIDRLMAVEQAVQVVKNHVVIGVKLAPDFDVAVNLAVDVIQRADRGHLRSGAPVAFPHPQHGRLADRAASGVEFLPFVLVAFLAAEKGFVNFDDPLQLVDGIRRATSLTEPTENEPRRLLRDSDFLRQLHTTDALPGRDQQVHAVNPLVQRHLRPLENGTRPNREVKVTGVAVVEADALYPADSVALAVGADRAFRPQPIFKVQPCRFVVREQLEEFEGADCALAHGSMIPEYRAFVNYTHVYKSQKCVDGVTGWSGYFCTFHAERHNMIVREEGGDKLALPIKEEKK